MGSVSDTLGIRRCPNSAHPASTAPIGPFLPRHSDPDRYSPGGEYDAFEYAALPVLREYPCITADYAK